VDYETVLQQHQTLFPGADYSRPETVEAFNKWWGQIEALPPGVWDAAYKLMAEKPDQRVAFVRDYGADLNKWLDGVVGWWSENGSTVGGNINEYGTEIGLLDALGYQVNPDAVPARTLDPNNPKAVALEQDILNTIIKDYINPDLEADKNRRGEADKIVTDITGALDNALKINDEILSGTFDSKGYLTRNPDVSAWAAQAVAGGQYPDLASAAKGHYDLFGKKEGRTSTNVTRLQLENEMADGTAASLAKSAESAAKIRLDGLDKRKEEMTAALAGMQTDRSGALDAQTAQLRDGLALLETERKAALEQLTSARVAAANAEVTGINQALQSERDRIVGRAAEKGYIGASTMEDTALARASMGARQVAAQTMGNARVANATDSRGLGDEIAGTRFAITGNDATSRREIADEGATGRFNLADSISQGRLGVADTLAGQKQDATDAGTKMRLGYFDNDFTRRLGAALVPVTIGTNKLSLLDASGQAGSTGMNRALNFLNFFSTGGTPPTSNPTNTAASRVGTDMAAFGAALTKAGFNVGNTVGWGKPKVDPSTNKDA
jgi:hypothetical protein